MSNDPNAIIFCGSGKPLEEKNYELNAELDENEGFINSITDYIKKITN